VRDAGCFAGNRGWRDPQRRQPIQGSTARPGNIPQAAERKPIFIQRFHCGVAALLILGLMIGPTGGFQVCRAEETPAFEWRDHLDIDGFIRGEVHVPALNRSGSENTFANTDPYYVLTSELKSDIFFSDSVLAFLNLRLRLYTDDLDTDGYIGSDADSRFDVREGFLKWRGEWLELTAGQQIFVWGKADGVNPTGSVWPQNFTIVSSDRDDRRLGVPAVKGDVYLGDYTLTGIWQAVFVDSNFKLSDLPDEAVITIEEEQLPARTLSNSIVALKLAAIFGSTDVSVSYYYGWEPIPDIILNEAVIGGDDEVTRVTVTPVFNRIENFGADFASVIGPVILRGEGAYKRVKDRGERSAGRMKSEIQWLVGPEFEWFENFTVNPQFGMTHVLDWEPVPEDESEIENNPQAGVDAFNARLNRQLNERNPFATLRLDYLMLQDTLFFQFRGLYWIDDKEIRMRPRIVYDINDHLNLTLAADLAFGPEDSRLERSGQSYNEVFAELKYSF
jgi:hypothetical protein